MKIKTKLLIMAALSVTCLMATAVFVFRATSDVEAFQNKSKEFQNQLLNLTSFRGQVRSLVFRVTSRKHQSQNDLTERSKAIAGINQRLLQLAKIASPSKVSLDKELDQYDVELLLTRFDLIDREIQTSDKLDADKIDSIFQTHFLPEMDTVIQEIELGSKYESIQLDGKVSQLRSIISISVAVNSLLLFFICFHLIYSIGTRLTELEKATQRLTVGDFNIQISTFGEDEISSLARSFSQMVNSLSLAKEDIVRKQAMLATQSKMAALGQMSAGVAHEINNPLAIIKGHGEKLVNRARANDLANEVAEKSGNTIIKSTQRIAGIVQSLRQTSQEIKQDGMASSSLKVVIEDALIEWRTRFESIGTNISLHLPEDQLTVFCKKSDLQQAFSNILSNAYDALNETTVEIKYLKIETRNLQNRIQLRVTDSGKGIPLEHRDKILQPFFTLKEVGKGAGLGLSSANGIISAHGGMLFLDDKATLTTFVIDIPREVQEAISA